MIRLTLLNGKYWYVNPDHIVGIKSGYKYGAEIESDHQTGIDSTIDVTHVTESPEEVARKVLEWRLAWEGGDVQTLYQMAGLEETNG